MLRIYGSGASAPGVAPEATPVPGALRQRKTIALLGDSVTGNMHGSGTPHRMRNHGYWTWADILSGHRLSFPRWNFGVGGDDSTMVLARVGSVVAVKPDYCVVETGGVDQSSMTHEQTVANLTAIYDALEAAGVYVIATTLYPQAPPGSITTAQRESLAKTNRWILDRRYTRKNYSVIDVVPIMLDYAGGGVLSAINMLHDGIHPGQRGAFLMGKALAAKIMQLEPETRDWVNNDPTDDWSVTNDYGMLTPNCMLAGSAGSKGSGVTGSVATGWTVSYLPSASGTAGVASKEAHPDLIGAERQCIVISGTPSADCQLVLSQSKSTSSGAPQFAKGKMVELFAEIEVVNGAGLIGVGLELRTSTSTTIAADGEVWSATATNMTSLEIPPGSWKGIFKTAPILFPTAAASLNPCVVITARSGLPVSGTIKIGRIGIRQAPVVP